MAQSLKRRTAHSHSQVESQLALLLDRELTRDQLRDVIRAFYGFWVGTEPLIECWAVADPAAASMLSWNRRRRAPEFVGDLVGLGMPPGMVLTVPRALPVFDAPGLAEVLGWLYVTEGATLGGAVIARHLGQLGARLRSFTPYDEGPGPMWRAYNAAAQALVDSGACQAEAVIAAAVTTFERLQTWVTLPAGALDSIRSDSQETGGIHTA